MTLDRSVGDGLAPALNAPDEADRFGRSAPAGRLVVAIGLAVSIIAHAVLIGFVVVKLQSTGRFGPNAQTIPIQVVPDPSIKNKNEKAAPVVAPKPDPAAQAKPTPARSAQPGVPQPPAQVGSQPPAPAGDALPSQALAPQDASVPPVATRGPVKTKMTQSETDALRAQIQRCWSLPQGWTDPRQVSVVVDFGMRIDGTVTGGPTVIEFQGTRYGIAAAQNALRAVLQCGPYRLPASTYSDWREAQVRLTPGG